MTVHVSMIVRNEAERHLAKTLANVRQILEETGGELIATDDGSDDDGQTIGMMREANAHLQGLDQPMFWKHEGRTRQMQQVWIDLHASPGDWILALDADETVNRPDLVLRMTQAAQMNNQMAVGMPLYEFWSDTEYRTDGYWFGTTATRLYRWQHGGQIRDKAMGSGSEPTYVSTAVLTGGYLPQRDLHLLHWGYLNPEDRVRKHRAYSKRHGGHGHNNAHVESIVSEPTLARYGSS